MEFIMINTEKLKIIISEEELKKYAITAEALDYSEIQTKKLLESILLLAKDKTGFDTEKSELCVKVFTSLDGGCEIFVTKRKEKDFSSDYGCPAGDYYLILNFETLHKLCKRINLDGYKLNSMLFSDMKGSYIFIPGISIEYISDNRIARNNFIPEYISEYGEIRHIRQHSLDYFSEYFTKIAEGDVVKLISRI